MVWWIRLKQQLMDYMLKRAPYLIVTVMMLIMGIVFGALAIKVLNPGQRTELWQYLTTFFDHLDNHQTVSPGLLLRQSVSGHLRILALITILGLSVIGSPLILLFLFTRGFVIGFSVGFLVERMVIKGILLSTVAVLPQNLLIVPALIMASVACLDFSVILVRGRMKGRGLGTGRELGSTMTVILLSGIGLMLASLIETYVCPVFLGLLGKLLV